MSVDLFSGQDVSRPPLVDPNSIGRLFAYGTLMADRNVQMLLGRKVKATSATLHNYLRVAPTWSFPFIVQQNGVACLGVVLNGLTTEDWAILDNFEDEGNLYWRREVEVILEDGTTQLCQSYIGRVDQLQNSFGKHVEFTDRYSYFLEKKINKLVEQIPSDRPEMHKRVLQELMGSAVSSILDSVFEGNFLCNYIMMQTLKESHPPHLREVLLHEEVLPYAGNYLRLASQHIILNQFVDKIREQSPEEVRADQQYLRHGIALLMALMYYNRHKEAINRKIKAYKLDEIDTRGYRDYAASAIEIADETYIPHDVQRIIEEVDEFWYNSRTPLGAELEFSYIGARAINAEPNEDKMFDAFYWFNDFDMMRRTWRLGGHIDSHCPITNVQSRNRGFLEYALGRYQILGDLSRPLFVCPWALSRIVNELVEFVGIPPHSLHISMEILKDHQISTDAQHLNDNLACLLLLAGDLRLDEQGKLREMRIFNRELHASGFEALNFYDRKIHYNSSQDNEENAAEVVEYKFPRLQSTYTDYESIVTALKGYMYGARCRPLTGKIKESENMPEQRFMIEWGSNPKPISIWAIDHFVQIVKEGLLMELETVKLEPLYRNILARIKERLIERNEYVRTFFGH